MIAITFALVFAFGMSCFWSGVLTERKRQQRLRIQAAIKRAGAEAWDRLRDGVEREG